MILESYLNLQYSNKISSHSKDGVNQSSSSSGISFQKGTLRSGENLDVDGDVLLVGDVNPGAKIAATGNVLVWGRLRGTAHAGTNGNQLAKIIALELRPLQLRIADKIARGPEEKPEPGLAEEAQLESGKIVIQPAKPNALRT